MSGGIDVISLVIRHQGGGAERTVELLREPLLRLGVRASTYALDQPLPGERGDASRTLTSRKMREPLRIAVSSWRLRKVLRRNRVQVLHLHCEAPELVGLLALTGLRHRPQVVVTEHTMASWVSWPRLGRWVRGRLDARGARLVSCFETDDDALLVIPNPVLPINLAKVREEPVPRFVSIGRVIASKRLEWLIDSLADMSPTPHLLVIGDGEALPALKALAGARGVDVHWAGYQSHPWALVRSGDVFVTASEVEGEPLALLEAISADLPVVASDIPAHRLVLGEHHGLFEEPAGLRHHELAALMSPTERELLRLRPDRRELVLSRRSPAAVAREWLTVYEQALNRSGTPRAIR